MLLIVNFGAVPRVLMDGIITNHQLSPGDGPGGGRLTVTGEDLSILMDLQQRSVEHPAQSAEFSVVTVLLRYAEYGIVPLTIPPSFVDIPLPIERVPLQHQTDLEYLQTLAAQFGYVFYVRCGPLPLQNIGYWGPPIRLGPIQKSLNVNLGSATNVRDLQFTYDALAPVLVQSEYQDLELGAELVVDTFATTRLPPFAAVPALLANVPNVRTIVRSNDGLDQIQAFAQAQAATDRSVDNVVQANGELDALRYGDVLNARDRGGVRGTGWSYDGVYYVKSVTHRISRRDYRQSFVLTREGVGSTLGAVPA
jgi:phage protein D